MKIFEKNYIVELFRLAVPIIMGNLGLTLLGAVDCFVGGRYSTSALAAISVATSIHATIMMLGIGLFVSVSPLLSNKRGAKIATKKYFFPTLKFAIFVGFILMLFTLAYIPFLKYFGFEQQLLKDVQIFTFILAFACIPAEINVSLKEFLQSYEIVLFPNLLLIVSVLLNLILDYIFVFGLCGCPEMGVAGIALATTLVRVIVAIFMLLFCFMNFKFKPFKDIDYCKQILKIGFPISISIVIEFIAFNYIAIILGRVSGVYAAAHNIILVFGNASFMIPLAISNALAVKVGYANGAKNYPEMIKYITNGMGVCVLFMLFAAIVYGVFPAQLASIFTSDKALISVIVPVMFWVACFQVSDGLQASLGGIYKGLKKTTFVMVSNFIAYLVIGVSLGTYLGIVKKMYLLGCWLAILISSFILTTILSIGLYRTLKKLKKEYLLR